LARTSARRWRTKGAGRRWASCSFPMVVFHPVSVAELGDAVPQTPWDLPLWSLKRQGHAGLGMPSPTCRLQASSRRSGCIPAEPYLPLKHPSNKGPCEPWQWRRKKPLLFSSFDRTAPSSFDRTTTAFSMRLRDSTVALPRRWDCVSTELQHQETHERGYDQG
jgi:hypothetical protein